MANELHVEWPKLFEVIADLAVDEHHDIVVKKQAIPLIFVPGIMGSRLRQTKSGKMVWDPDSKWLMIKLYGLKQFDPAGRKALIVGPKFSPSFLEVDWEGEADTNADHFTGNPDAVDRGWTTISWGSYGDFMKAAHKHDWGERLPNIVDFPLHAYGYNWTDDNRRAGRQLAEYIDEVIDTYKQTHICEKVILLTHSMGGLVARSACGLHGADSKVLAVIHGVQPSSGAPAAYWRMKGGFERPGSAEDAKWYHWLTSPKKMLGHKVAGTITTWVLGPDGPSVTALLANIPGGLELLPTKAYTTNAGESGWLALPGQTGMLSRRPIARDPYAEIYRERSAYWRLVKPEWLDPGRRPGATMTKDGIPIIGPWDQYLRMLSLAERFHDDLGTYTHAKTTQFYSEGIHTFDEVAWDRELHSWTTTGKRILEGLIGGLPAQSLTEVIKALLGIGRAFNPLTLGSMLVTAAIKDSDFWVNRGGYRAYVDELDNEVGRDGTAEVLYLLTLKEAKGSGDGTVPVSSGKFLAAAEKTLVVGKDEEHWLDRGHEPIYLTKTGQKYSFEAVDAYTLSLVVEPEVG